MSKEEYLEFLEAREQTEFGKIWRVYRRLMFELVDEYLNARHKQREELRKKIWSMDNVQAYLFRLCDEQSWLIRDRSDEPLLRRLIGFISIADSGYTLPKQFLVTDLYDQATKVAQIEIGPLLSEIAKISSDKTEHISSGVSTQKFLKDFQLFDRSHLLDGES
ncbi:hypothetical protein Pan153_29140 [Gimesia panareensis]|uniref:Uncharacterized protein n=1 Tax=Gimesia panareensis TaxID=2527978 RepID=A0A518FPJ2_9PLAN|nr:hypothetical protein [Gimesia panareensis]QDV18257.1 hypothetical protein Pan153_29140 [Gimesia panareensis]